MDKLIVAVTCHQGLGSSIWLKLLVSKFMQEHHIPNKIIQSDLHSLTLEKIDLVIGMKYLEDQIKALHHPYIVIDNMLDKELYAKLIQNETIKQYL